MSKREIVRARSTSCRAFTIRGDRVRGRRAAAAAPAAMCSARSYAQVEFTNPIAVAAYRAAQGPDRRRSRSRTTRPSGDAVGLTAARRRQRVHDRVGDGIVDIYGQPLVGRAELAFTTGAAAVRAVRSTRDTGLSRPRSAVRDPAVGRADPGGRVGARPALQGAAGGLLRVRGSSRRASARRRRASACSTRRTRSARGTAPTARRSAARAAPPAPATWSRSRPPTPAVRGRTSGSSRRASRGSRSPGSGMSARIDGEQLNAWVAATSRRRSLPGAGRRRRDVARRRGRSPASAATGDQRRRRPRRASSSRRAPAAAEGRRPEPTARCSLVAQRATDSTFAAIGGCEQRDPHATTRCGT